MSINVAVYFVCVVLILPMTGLALLSLLVESLAALGFWEVFKTILAPFYDPLGRGLWIFVFLISAGMLVAAGFFENYRPYGLGLIALAGTIGCVIVMKVAATEFDWNWVLFYAPAVAGIALSVYSIVRPFR